MIMFTVVAGFFAGIFYKKPIAQQILPVSQVDFFTSGVMSYAKGHATDGARKIDFFLPVPNPESVSQKAYVFLDKLGQPFAFSSFSLYSMIFIKYFVLLGFILVTCATAKITYGGEAAIACMAALSFYWGSKYKNKNADKPIPDQKTLSPLSFAKPSLLVRAKYLFICLIGLAAGFGFMAQTTENWCNLRSPNIFKGELIGYNKTNRNPFTNEIFSSNRHFPSVRLIPLVRTSTGEVLPIADGFKHYKVYPVNIPVTVRGCRQNLENLFIDRGLFEHTSFLGTLLIGFTFFLVAFIIFQTKVRQKSRLP
jgi:hypothetical protein